MGTYVHELGGLHIPDEKKNEFIADAKKVAFQGGLFSRSFSRIKGKDLIFLSFPSFEEGKYADFTYNYFENAPWENAGIQLEDVVPYSEKIGWAEFNQVVQALYILAELYSTTPYISYNDSVNRPNATMQWLRYLLGRNIQNQWRWDVWKIYEMYVEANELNTPEAEVDIDFLDEILTSNNDGVGLISAVYVSYGTDWMAATNTKKKKEAEDPKHRIYTIDDFIYMLKLRINEYKEHSSDSEEKQIQFLLHYLTCDPEERDVNKAEEQYKGLLIAIHFTTPQIIVKVISEIYQKDFWSLWKQVQDSITLDSPDYLDKNSMEIDEKYISTEKFLSVSSDDRLYWWTEESDVHISVVINTWLNQLHQRFLELCGDVGADAANYTDRLVELVVNNPRILFFEDLFYEFFSGFHKAEYRAALRLLEEVSSNDQEYKRLIAVFANHALREKYFAF